MSEKTTKSLAIELYRRMVLCRKFEEKVVELVNKNEIYGTTHEYIGEEAVASGVCTALRSDDLLASTHRGHGHIVSKGGDVKYMFAELFGRVDGYNRGKGGSMHIADVGIGVLGANGIVGAGVPIAAGAALAIKIKKLDKVVISFFGDGASNQGVVHEAMNMAAIWDLPIIFVCENNQYAVSTSVKYSLKIDNISERSKAYGFEGKTVNGMDVLDVYYNSREIVGKVRRTGKPFLLECKTYRYSGHFTAERMLNLNYRTEEEINYYKSICPIKTFSARMIEDGICTKKEFDDIDNSIIIQIDEAVDFARKSKAPQPSDALNDMYATEFKTIPQKGWI
jgi:pyruvate dehydrogenase E1 component alpha subunit